MTNITQPRQPGPDRSLEERRNIQSALSEWNEVVEKHAAKFGGDRVRGAVAANRECPDLRQRVDDLVNG